MNLTPQQLGTVMAALRYWQKDMEENEGDYPGDFWDIAADGGAFEPLNVDEIDALCEDINCGPPSADPAVRTVPDVEYHTKLDDLLTEVMRQAGNLVFQRYDHLNEVLMETARRKKEAETHATHPM